MRFSYALNAEDITDIDSYVDLQRLEIGQYFSKYYSFFIFNNDSLVWVWKSKKQAAQSIPSWLGPLGKGKYYWSEYKYSEFFKDYQNNTITEYARMPNKIGPYIMTHQPLSDIYARKQHAISVVVTTQHGLH